MAEKKTCSLCGELREDLPAVHDPITCEIRGLKNAVAAWKEAWYHQRDIIGKLSWKHLNCPHEQTPATKPLPNPWLHPEETFVQEGGSVYRKTDAGWKLVGDGSPAAAEGILRLMNIKE